MSKKSCRFAGLETFKCEKKQAILARKHQMTKYNLPSQQIMPCEIHNGARTPKTAIPQDQDR